MLKQVQHDEVGGVTPFAIFFPSRQPGRRKVHAETRKGFSALTLSLSKGGEDARIGFDKLSLSAVMGHSRKSSS